MSTVYVNIKRAPLSRLPGRQQRWFWLAQSGDNRRTLARSTERYSNREDCVAAIRLLFGADTRAVLRRREQDGWPASMLGNWSLRYAKGDAGYNQ